MKKDGKLGEGSGPRSSPGRQEPYYQTTKGQGGTAGKPDTVANYASNAEKPETREQLT